MRIAFAGGGTGGHVFPVQSLITYIHTVSGENTTYESHHLLWFGEKPSLEYTRATTLRTDIPELQFIQILSGKYRRQRGFIALCHNIVDIGKLMIGVVQSLYYCIRYRVDVVFCKGGYVSLPVVCAGRMLGKPIVLHESDTTPGLANRICSLFASKIFTGFEGVFPGKEVVVGQILSDDLVVGAYEDRDNLCPTTNLLPDSQTHILVTGGSQGAQTMYEPLVEIISSLTSYQPLPHFHIVLGTKNLQLASAFNALPAVTVYEFVEQKTMGRLLALCDVAITRGGTTSLAEQQLFNIHKIIIPIPRTHDQKKNALYYQKHYGDCVVLQDTATYIRDFTDAVVSVRQYKKGAFGSPVDTITQPKRILYEALINR